MENSKIEELLETHKYYRQNKLWNEADKITALLLEKDIICSDNKDGITTIITKAELKKLSEEKILKQKEEQERKRNEKLLSGIEFKGRHTKVKNKKRKKTKNRGEMFANWIVEKFGINLLKGGVLDIAGGKGHVSYFLCKNLIKCTVVDPMPLKLSNAKTKEIIRISRDQIEQVEIKNKSDLKLEEIKNIWNELIKNDIRLSWLNNEAIYEKVSNLTDLSTIADIATIRLDELNLQHCKHLFDNKTEECSKLVKECNFILGLHPDQATEDIVDMALSANKPFAVIPCCVFPNLFSNRIGPDGCHVRSYEQFLDYLQAKDKNIKREIISTMAGPNNICLFYNPVY